MATHESSRALTLEWLSQPLAVARLAPTDPIPAWALASPFFCVARTGDELSVLCEEGHIPSRARAERNWRALRVEGPLDFALTGILAGLLQPLAEARISVFALSTFDTDYVLVKAESGERVQSYLTQAGFRFRNPI